MIPKTVKAEPSKILKLLPPWLDKTPYAPIRMPMTVKKMGTPWTLFFAALDILALRANMAL
jgi:hypothetical protein